MAALVVLPVFSAIGIGFGLVIEYLNVENTLRRQTGLKSNYGLIGLVMLFNIYILMYLGFQVGAARRKYGVKYPDMYADVKSAKNKKNANLFNCIQRAHQNSLERM